MTDAERRALEKKHEALMMPYNPDTHEGQRIPHPGWAECNCDIAKRLREGTLFGLAEGERRKAEGQARVTDNEREEWKAAVDRLIEARARTHLPFTADDIRADAAAAGVPPPHHPNAWGARFTAAARRGVIERERGEPVKSRQPQNHACTLPQWIGMGFA